MLFCETYQPGTHRSVTLYPPSLRMLAIPRLVATTSALFIFSWTLSSALALAEFPLVPAEILKSLLRVFLTVSGISCTIPWSKPYSIDGREVLVYNMQWVSSCPIQQGGKWYKSSGLSVSGQPGQNGGFREPICSASSLSFFLPKVVRYRWQYWLPLFSNQQPLPLQCIHWKWITVYPHINLNCP